MNSSLNPPSAKSAQAFPRKDAEKEKTYGLHKPLDVKWIQDSVVGPYITISVANSATRTPTEFVVSKHIGKSAFLDQALVINRRKDVPDLITGAADPMKKRHKEISDRMDRDLLISKGYLEDKGGRFLITPLASATLQGQDVDHYLDHANKLFQTEKDSAKAEHEKAEALKPFRLRKKFLFKKTFDSFLSNEEKALKALFNGATKSVEHVSAVEAATRSTYETLVDGERPQARLHLTAQNWEHLTLTGVADLVSKTIMSVLNGTFQKESPSEAQRKLEAKVAEQTQTILEQKHEMEKMKAFFTTKDPALAGLAEENKILAEHLRATKEQVAYLEEQLEDLANEELLGHA